MRNFSKISIALVALVCFNGCGAPGDTSDTQTAAQGGGENGGGHSHDHGDVGPHGGHLLHLEPSGAHAEWTHDDDTHSISVFLDDFQADKIESAKFVATIGEETEEFGLESTENGWTISSEALMTHINMGEAVEVCLVVVDDTGEHTCTIEAHEHHHH